MILEQLDILFALNKLGIKCKLEGNKIALNQLVLVCANIAMLILIYSFLAFRVMACGLHSSENIPVGKQGAHRGAECFCLSESAWNHTETQGTESKASYPCQWTFLKSFGLFFLFPACLISPVFTDHQLPWVKISDAFSPLCHWPPFPGFPCRGSPSGKTQLSRKVSPTHPSCSLCHCEGHSREPEIFCGRLGKGNWP